MDVAHTKSVAIERSFFWRGGAEAAENALWSHRWGKSRTRAALQV